MDNARASDKALETVFLSRSGMWRQKRITRKRIDGGAATRVERVKSSTIN